jgi:DNA primase
MTDLSLFKTEVLARITLSDLISPTVKLTKAGREFKGLCPVHQEKTPSFRVVDDKGFAHCHGCGAHFDAISWMMQMRGMGFIEALRELGETVGLSLPERSPEAQARAERIIGLRPTLDAAQALFRAALLAEHREGAAARAYLAERGIDDQLSEAFGLGLATEGGGLTGQGFTRGDLIASGLLGKSQSGHFYARFKHRITIPIHDRRGRLVSFGGRKLPKAEPGKDIAKYINGPETDLFDKGRILFNHHRAFDASRTARRVIVTEGYMDVIALARVGIGEALAPMGTALTESQWGLLWQMHHRPILMFDGDKAGRAAARRACQTALPMLGPGHEAAIVILPQGQDPDDMTRGMAAKEGRAVIDAMIAEAKSVHDFLYDDVVGGAS